ncbi:MULTISPECIES: hypothetical protein [Serratia]|nr:hypothetical protein [Serratia ureilytica]
MEVGVIIPSQRGPKWGLRRLSSRLRFYCVAASDIDCKITFAVLVLL